MLNCDFPPVDTGTVTSMMTETVKLLIDLDAADRIGEAASTSVYGTDGDRYNSGGVRGRGCSPSNE